MYTIHAHSDCMCPNCSINSSYNAWEIGNYLICFYFSFNAQNWSWFTWWLIIRKNILFFGSFILNPVRFLFTFLFLVIQAIMMPNSRGFLQTQTRNKFTYLSDLDCSFKKKLALTLLVPIRKAHRAWEFSI